MKSIYLVVCALTMQLMFVGSAFAKENADSSQTVGLTASFQSSQVDILVPVWVSNNVSISPAFGLAWEEGSGADLHVGIVPRYYLVRKVVSPYVGLRVALLQTIPASGSGISSSTDWLAGFEFGAEYFFNRHLSFGVESQGNFTFSSPNSSRFGNPGKTNFNTAAAVFATVYF